MEDIVHFGSFRVLGFPSFIEEGAIEFLFALYPERNFGHDVEMDNWRCCFLGQSFILSYMYSDCEEEYSSFTSFIELSSPPKTAARQSRDPVETRLVHSCVVCSFCP